MDVQCPKCGTVFEFDEAQMRSSVATLKCSVCTHLFRIQTDAQVSSETQRRWMVRSASSGDIHYFTGFDELHRMLMSGRASREDTISRTGKRWMPLEDMGEFVPVFQALDSIASLTRGDEVAQVPDVGDVLRDRARTIQQFASSPAEAPAPAAPARSKTLSMGAASPRPVPRPTPVPPRPEPREEPAPVERAPARAPEPSPMRTSLASSHAPTEPPKASRAARHEEQTELDSWSLGDVSSMASTTASMHAYEAPVVPPRRSRAGLVVLLVLLLLGGGVGYAWMFERPRVLELAEQAGISLPVEDGPRDDDGVVASGEPSEGEGDAVEPPDGSKGPDLSPASDAVAASVEAARVAVASVVGGKVSKSVSAAHKKLRVSVDGAAKRAKRHAERNDVGAILKGGRRALDRGQRSKARDAFGRALELDPGNVEAMTGLGWSLLGMGRVDSAVAQFKRALHFDSGHEDAYIGLGKAERRRGNLKGALSAYERYLAAFPRGSQASIARHQRDELKRSLGM